MEEKESAGLVRAKQTMWSIVPCVLLTAMLLVGCDRPRPGSSAVPPRERIPDLPAPLAEIRAADLPPDPDDFAPQAAPPIPLDTTASNWELQLAGQLSHLKPTEKARAIFALLPTLPESALATVTEQAVEKLPDADYAATALPVIANPATHGQILSILFADLLERPDAIALPALLAIARNPDHPFGPSALDDLRLLLNADYDDDWSRWDSAILQKLAIGR